MNLPSVNQNDLQLAIIMAMAASFGEQPLSDNPTGSTNQELYVAANQ